MAAGLVVMAGSLQSKTKQKGRSFWRKPVHMYHLVNQLSRTCCKGSSMDLAAPINNDRGKVSEPHQPRLIVKVLVIGPIELPDHEDVLHPDLRQRIRPMRLVTLPNQGRDRHLVGGGWWRQATDLG